VPDGGFVRQIWKYLADLKVNWRAKYISGGLLVLADFWRILTPFFRIIFVWQIWRISGGFGLSIWFFAPFRLFICLPCNPPA
jgi:hypothetical protein